MARATRKTIVLNDFTGGLDTAIAEARLPYTKSAALHDVDFTESGGISTRTGYVSVTGTPIAANEVSELYRLYREGAANRWMAVCGTALYTSQDAANEYSWVPAGAGALLGSGTATSTISGPEYFGGAVLQVTSATFNIPTSTDVRMRLLGGSNCASISIDGGAWSSISGSATGWAYEKIGLAETTHTVALKTPALNASSLCSGIDKHTLYDFGSDATRRIRVSFLTSESGYFLLRTSGGTDVGISGFAGSASWQTVEFPPTNMRKFYYACEAQFNYADCLYVNDILVEDGADASSWGGMEVAGGTYYSTPTIRVESFQYATTSDWTHIGSISATADYVGFTTLNGSMFYSTAYDTVHSTVGATAVVVATSPEGAFMTSHKRRIFSAGDKDDPSLLSYTDVDEPEDWAGGGSIRLASKDAGDECTGLTVFDNNILYFANDRIWGLDITGADTDWNVAMSGYSAKSWNIGCVSPRSIAHTDTAVIFFASDRTVRAFGSVLGLFATDGTGLINMGVNIWPTLRAISDSSLSAACGAFFKGRYWLSVDTDGDGVNDTTFVCDLSKVHKLSDGTTAPAWTQHNYGMASFCVTRGDEYGLYGGDTANGHVYKLDTGHNDNGSAISWAYKTPPLSPKGYAGVYHFKHLHLAAEATTTQSLAVDVTTDDAAPASQNVSITGTTDVQPLRAKVPSRGRSIQYEFSADANEQPVTISSVTTTFIGPRVR